MNRAMADWIPAGELSRMVSLGLLGVPMAMLLGGPLLSHMIEFLGWRQSFIGLGFDGFSAAFGALVVLVSTAVLGLLLLAHPDHPKPARLPVESD